MSTRMMHRIDLITSYGRWLALAVVPIIALLIRPEDLEVSTSILLAIVGLKAIVDLISLSLLHLELFPDFAALTFLILDSVFALVLLLLAGPGMFVYSFMPVIGFSARFEWTVGLADAATLTAAYIGISLVQAGPDRAGSVLAATFGQAVGLLLVSAFGGLLTASIKREPPLNVDEARARESELQKLQAATDRLRAIYEMASTLVATLNSERILEAVLEVSAAGFKELAEHSMRLSGKLAGAVFLLGPEGMYIAASRAISYQERNQTASGEQGVLRSALQSGEPFTLGNLADDPELRQFSAFRRCRSAICVPLRAGFEIYGVALFASPQPKAFGPEHIELMSAVSNQAAVALANAQLYQDLQEEKEAIVRVQEETRTKLARDLHDGPTQAISAIAMRLNFVRLLLGQDPERAKAELFKLENLARRTTKEIRTMLFTLRPVVLETQGLKVAVEQLVQKLQEIDELPVSLEIEDLEGKLDVNVQAVAWFITEECLQNVKKHAHASHTEVKMYIRDGCFVTEVTDNGEGFDLETVMSTYDQRDSFGLLNLQERAELVNGRTTIKSAPGKGTQVTLTVPLAREAV